MKKVILLSTIIAFNVFTVNAMEHVPQTNSDRPTYSVAKKTDWMAVFEFLNSTPGSVDCRYPDQRGELLISKATEENNYSVVKQLLLHYGANPNLINSSGITALMIACLDNNLRLIKLLLRYGADPKKKDIYGYDSFSYAQNKPKIIEMLTQNWLLTSPGSF